MKYELLVSPGGIFYENAKVVCNWSNLWPLEALAKEAEIKLQPFDGFTKKHEHYLAIEKIVSESDGKIEWAFPPHAEQRNEE